MFMRFTDYCLCHIYFYYAVNIYALEFLEANHINNDLILV